MTIWSPLLTQNALHVYIIQTAVVRFSFSIIEALSISLAFVTLIVCADKKTRQQTCIWQQEIQNIGAGLLLYRSRMNVLGLVSQQTGMARPDFSFFLKYYRHIAATQLLRRRQCVTNRPDRAYTNFIPILFCIYKYGQQKSLIRWIILWLFLKYIMFFCLFLLLFWLGGLVHDGHAGDSLHNSRRFFL